MAQNTRTRTGLALFLLAGGLSAGSANAQWTASDTYEVRHDFLVTPGGNVTPRVKFFYFQHAWLYEYMGAWGAYTQAGVAPPQGPGFDLLGTEGYANLMLMNYPRHAANPPTNCLWGWVDIPDTGKTDWGCTRVLSPNSNSHANACTDYLVASYGVGTPIQGYIRAMGNAYSYTYSYTETYAFSAAAILIEAGTQLASGQIVWTPWMDSVHDSSHSIAVRKDPITISWDGSSAGEVTLLDADMNVRGEAGGGASSWKGDVVEFGASEGVFYVDINPAVTKKGGTARMEVTNGVVVVSNDSGAFDGLLPAVGAQTPLKFDFPSKLNVIYDITPHIGNASNIGLYMGGGAGGPARAGCPADVDASGFVDTDDFDAFVGMFTEGGPAADFDHSGFVDTDDYDAFVRAFESGC
ncbi:MAG: hypothetical protein IT435_17450 [Phycisphaerales bacterium]|nr:hypothetical protein [Phycisphaerales bacterium]